jgi:hypothetical protein
MIQVEEFSINFIAFNDFLGLRSEAGHDGSAGETKANIT